MRLVPSERLRADCLVVGSGVAGLLCALSLADSLNKDGLSGTRGARILVAAKSALDDTNTRRAQGGIAAVLGEDDTFSHHAADTLEAGRGLCDENVVSAVVRTGPGAIAALRSIGARFDASLGREGGHSARRVAHAADATGAEVQRALCDAARSHSLISVREHHLCAKLLIDPRRGRCAGALLVDLSTGACVEALASHVVLATGGAGRLWQHTSNPPGATADGVWLAYEAGAQLADIEFMQFHPTTLDVAGAENSLLTEALRGEGAHLVNENGERIMAWHPLRELAPRDVVSQAIWREVEAGSKVFLDMRPLGAAFLRECFPTVWGSCAEHGLDPSRELVPIVPAAHFLCGGVRTDAKGRTSLPGLYAIGECACSGLHGANRLASNSLLEGAVFGLAASRTIASAVLRSPSSLGEGAPVSEPFSVPLASGERLASLKGRLAACMWRHLGLVRTAAGMRSAGHELSFLAAELTDSSEEGKPADLRSGLEMRSMLGVARLMAASALLREESRGCHQRQDIRGSSEAWRCHIVLERGSQPRLCSSAGLGARAPGRNAGKGAGEEPLPLRLAGWPFAEAASGQM